MIGAQRATWRELEQAGRVLFGPAFGPGDVSAGRWRTGLKAAYRRRVLETHPDRARALGRSEHELAREFRAVTEAYRLLAAAGAVAPVPPPRPQPRPAWTPPAPRARTEAPRPRREERAWRPAPRTAPPPRPAWARAPAAAPDAATPRRRSLPRRRLRLAEFLYYSGRISFGTFLEAIVWQRKQRPAAGRVAIELGLLTFADVIEILETRRRDGDAVSVPFGEWAVRTGKLTPFQVLAVLGAQRRRQRPIGQFFVECGLLRAGEVEAVLRAMWEHNARQRG
ncbi:MAG TPA: J domain-containing protein [Anaeromyxobacteraceae bacterium]|nr:J domain-containing protein [Anaeromyxobacteraceae bacterium]